MAQRRGTGSREETATSSEEQWERDSRVWNLPRPIRHAGAGARRASWLEHPEPDDRSPGTHAVRSPAVDAAPNG